MNMILVNGLPDNYKGIDLSTDFRNMVQVDMIMGDSTLKPDEATFLALHQLYPKIPKDKRLALEGLEWFYSCGKSENKQSKEGKPFKKTFDFNIDSNLIYAGFYSAYKISLTTIDYLHWWEFMALFEGLPEETLIKRVMYWRGVDLSKLSKEEQKHIEEMRELYPLGDCEHKPKTVEELNQQTLDRVKRRFQEAHASLER